MSGRSASRGPRTALGLVLLLYLSLSLAILLLTPPWEPNDEAEHVRNVETLVEGRAYRIPDRAAGQSSFAGIEVYQAPLYYLLLAQWQRLLGESPRTPVTVARTAVGGLDAPHPGEPFYQHGTATEAADRTLARSLRLPGLAFGLGLILLTWATARRLSDDEWTPVVAAAIAASVPKFSFLSAAVNNDNLVDVLGALGTLAAVVVVSGAASTHRGRIGWSIAIGLVLGALVLTKVSTMLFAVPLTLAAFLSARSRREGAALVGVVLGAALLVCGWWLVRNTVWYGDPLANDATRTYLGALVEPIYGPAEQAFVKLPQGVWKSAWYNSGWNQFYWPWWAYFPFWFLATIGLGGFLRALRHGGDGRSRAPYVILLVFLVCAIAIVWIVGLSTPQTQARIGFGGLAAVACLIGIGYERLRLPLPARFLLPALGFAGTAFALFDDVIRVYH